MATAPIEALEEQGNDTADTEINYEAEARKYGWKPLDELDGKVDPARFVDAETFYKRGQEFTPILKAANKRLEREVADLKKSLARASDFFSKAEERAYQRALADITAKQEAAVESGDLEAFRAANKDAENLRKEMQADTGGSDAPDEADQRAEDFADWGRANKWYAENSIMQAYADAQAAKLARAKGDGGFLSREDLDTVAERVREKFEDDYPEAFGKAKLRQKTPHVDPGGARQHMRGGKTFNDLPAEARAACDKWVKQGLIKSREDYVKSYQWS